MKKNCFLREGENDFLILKEKQLRKERFFEKYPNGEIYDFFKENRNLNTFFSLLQGGSLFDNPKIIFVNGLPNPASGNKYPSSDLEKLQNFLDTFEGKENIFLIFISSKPDKRTKFYKFIKKNFENKEFKKTRINQISKIFENKLKQIKFSNPKENLDYLITKIGNDLFFLDNEIQKLYEFQQQTGQIIDNQTIDFVCFGQITSNSFDFFDYIFTQPKSAYKILQDILQKGDDFNQILGMFYWGIKNYILFYDIYYNHQINNSKIIAEKLKIHPFVAMKLLKQKNEIYQNYSKIKKFLDDLIKIEKKIKTGKLQAENFGATIKNIFFKNFLQN